MQFSDLLEQYDDDTSASEEQQTAARPRTAHAASNATSAAARPQSAFRPQPARAGELSSDRKPTTWLPAGKKSLSRNPISQRPATAGAKGPISKHATLAQLKAELAAVAAGGNMQLQSLSPRTVPIDASAELQAQVLEQLANLDVSMTYSQARAAAAEELQYQHSPAPVTLDWPRDPEEYSPWNRTAHLLQHSSSASSNATDSRRQRTDQLHSPSQEQSSAGVRVSMAGARGSTAGVRASVARARGSMAGAAKRNAEAATAAALGAISEMKQWAIDQELSMMEPSAAEHYASKALAAHVGMLQSEALVLQYQRRFVEAELQKLKATTGLSQHTQQQNEQQNWQQYEQHMQQHGQALEHNDLQHPHQYQQQQEGHMFAHARHQQQQQQQQHHFLQDGHHIMRPHTQSAQGTPAQGYSFTGWAGAEQHSMTENSFLLVTSNEPSELHRSSSCDHLRDTDHDTAQHDTAQQGAAQQQTAGANMNSWRDSSPGRQYLETDSLPGSLAGQNMPQAHVLRMTHVGLGRQHLDKVQVALEAADSRVHLLDLSSNLFSDSAVYDLVELIQALPAASDISHFDLSHNQLLSWQCCGALGQLVSVAAAIAAATAVASAKLSRQSADHADANRQQHNVSPAGATRKSADESVEGTKGAAVLAVPAPARRPVAWGGAQPSFKRMVQPLQLQALLLQGVVIQDRGAVLLAEALAGTQRLQVLDVSRCGILDAGGAAICSALQQQDTLWELHLSWNALSHGTAQALETVLRTPGHSLSHLHLSHCGFGDRDGALILNALVDAAVSRSSSEESTSSSGSSSGSGAWSSDRDWVHLDLAYNALEGGAALCAAALVAAEAAAAAAAAASSDYSGSSGCGLTASFSNGWGQQQSAGKCLVLDGNPLGASGVRILMRAVAAEPAVGIGAQPGQSVPSAAAGQTMPLLHRGSGYVAEGTFFLQERHHMSEVQYQHLHVGIAKVSLLAKEKGFRASMRAAESAQAFAAQVPTLLDAAAAPPSKPAPKGITKPPSGKAAASKAAPASTAVAAAAAAASNALSVVHETAAGYNLYCPAGLYQLSLKHPGAKHLFDQLMALRALLQQLQQQAKDQHAQQQQQQQELEQAAVTAAIAATAAAAARNADTVSANPRAEPVVRSRSPSRRVSRANSPMPSEPSAVGLERAASTHAPGTSSPSGMASRRVSRTASTMARARPAPKPRLAPVLVEVPALVDLKLDGKATKLEGLLQLSPWYKSLQQQQQRQQAAAAEAAAQAEQAAAPATAAKGGQAGAKKKGKPKDPQVLEFTVKAAAALTGADPPVMPAGLLEWAIEVLRDTSCGDVWKLQFMELLVQDWLLLPQQAVHLLNMFDRELGQDEQLMAAGLMWAHLVQPMDLWEEVLPHTLRPSQQKQLKRMLGPRLMALDRSNLTGHYSLDLSSDIHRAVAWRLQLAALQDNATSECKYYVSWRNVSLNGDPLPDEAMARLQLYAIPCIGRLKLDYVSYQAPQPGMAPVSQPHLHMLLTELRRMQHQYNTLVLSLRQEYLPKGVRKSQEEAKAAAAKARDIRDPGRGGKVGQAGNRTGLRKASAAVDLAKQLQPSAAATAPATAAEGATEVTAGSQPAAVQGDQPPQVLAQPPGEQIWWSNSGFDASELLLKYQPRPISPSAASVGSDRRGSRGNRHTTRDAVERKSPGALASRRQLAGSAGSRPMSAAAAAAGAAAAGAAGNADASRRNTRPGSSRPPGSAGSGFRSSLHDSSSVPQRTQGVTDQEMLARLLHASTPQSVAAAFTRLGCKHAAAVLQLLAGRDEGMAAVAALLQCLSPVVAVRFMHEMPGYESSLLPADTRTAIKPLLPQTVLDSLQEVATTLREAAKTRDSQLLLCVRNWASQVQAVTCSQLGKVLQVIGTQTQLRCSVIVALWNKVLDRQNLVKVFEALSKDEQLGLMSALGSYHVWFSLGQPDGLHFRLDLTQPEQREVAREVVKTAVKRTLAAGKGSGVRHLLNMIAEASKPVADPEDDKLWLSLESKHSLLEFDFARTWQQELHIMEGAVKHIQRAWRSRTAARMSALHGNRSGSIAGSTRSGLSPASLLGMSSGGSLPATAGGAASGGLYAGQTAAGDGAGLLTRPLSGNLLSSQSQITSPSGVLSSSYTAETSCSSYTLYSSEPSGLTGGMGSGLFGSVSLQLSQLSASGLVGAYSSELSGLSGLAEAPGIMAQEPVVPGSWSGSNADAAVSGGCSLAGSAGGTRAGQGGHVAQQAGQHLAQVSLAGSSGSAVAAFSSGGLEAVAQGERGPVQRVQGVDLGAGLATFRAAGLVPNSLDPTPRLARNGGQ